MSSANLNDLRREMKQEMRDLAAKIMGYQNTILSCSAEARRDAQVLARCVQHWFAAEDKMAEDGDVERCDLSPNTVLGASAVVDLTKYATEIAGQIQGGDFPCNTTVIGAGGTASKSGQLTLAANNENVLEFYPDGRIVYRGREIATDAELVESMRDWVQAIANTP